MAQSVSGTGSAQVGPRLRGVRWGLGTLVVAAGLAYYAAYGDSRHIASQERAVPFIIGVVTAVVVLVFGLLVPAALRGIGAGSSRWTGAGLALSIVALLVLPVTFWSGLPVALGTAAGLLGAEGRRVRRTGLATATLVIGAVVVVLDLAWTIVGNMVTPG